MNLCSKCRFREDQDIETPDGVVIVSFCHGAPPTALNTSTSAFPPVSTTSPSYWCSMYEGIWWGWRLWGWLRMT